MDRSRSLSEFLLTVAALLLWFLIAKPAHAFEARLAHDSGNGDGRRTALSDSLEIGEAAEDWGYAVFACRDDFTGDRMLLNAMAVISAGKQFGDHRFYLGLGAHARQQKLHARTAGAPDFLPAGGFAWYHPAFHLQLAAGERLTRASLSFLVRIAIPFEFNSDFEYLESQPYRWSANIFAFVSRYGGFIAGYEPVALRVRAGIWVRPLENLQLRTLARLNPTAETFWEFSLAYSFATESATTAEPVARVVSTQEKTPRKKAVPQKVPAFATLVKWGLTPVEALRFAREKDICALSAGAQAALKRHRWECRDAT